MDCETTDQLQSSELTDHPQKGRKEVLSGPRPQIQSFSSGFVNVLVIWFPFSHVFQHISRLLIAGFNSGSYVEVLKQKNAHVSFPVGIIFLPCKAKLGTYTGVLEEGSGGQRKIDKFRATFWDSKLLEFTLNYSNLL